MRRHSSLGLCGAAFSLGMIAAYVCPAKWLVVLLALLLITTGILCLR